MKYIIIIPDGLGDRPLKVLSEKTPLGAARTPHLDALAREGTVGLSQNIPKGFIPGTDVGVMSVFGYDPRRFFTGRGPLEAAFLGIHLKENQVAFRCNLITVEGDLLKDYSGDHLSSEEAVLLMDFLNEELGNSKVRFYAGKGTGYRNSAIFEEEKHELDKLVCTPPHDIMGHCYRDYFPKGKSGESLAQLMNRSVDLLSKHPVNIKRLHDGKGPANMIWLWGQGRPLNLPSYHTRFGLHGGVITAVDLVKGIGLHAGLDIISVPGVTGYFDTNYAGKAEYALNSLRSRDLVIIHIESTDEAGHMGRPDLKVQAVEDIDRFVVGTLVEKLWSFGDFQVMVLPDHFTCVETRTHASDPVPFLIFSSKKQKKGPRTFSEETASQSGVLIQEGHTLMEKFIKGDF